MVSDRQPTLVDPPARERVSLFVTCLVDLFEPEVGVATVRLLRAAGCSVDFFADQTCCGQPAWNAGFADEAAQVARTTLAALERGGDRAIVVPAGSCATMIRVYWPELFEVVGDDGAAERARRIAARTYELTEFLAMRDLRLLAAGDPQRVAYHHSCHMQRELRIREAPEALLDRAMGCERVEWPSADRCCGFGGTFSVRLPEVSVAMTDAKFADLPADCRVIVGADTSCLMQLAGRAGKLGRRIEFRHIAEVLADALEPRPDHAP